MVLPRLSAPEVLLPAGILLVLARSPIESSPRNMLPSSAKSIRSPQRTASDSFIQSIRFPSSALPDGNMTAGEVKCKVGSPFRLFGQAEFNTPRKDTLGFGSGHSENDV